MNIIINERTIGYKDGLYNLNDLHKASGGSRKHEPYLFLRQKQINALIEELKCPDMGILGDDKYTDVCIKPVMTLKGRYGGTYVCKELVVAYAAWISPAFHLKVIRVFLDSQMSGDIFNYPKLTDVERHGRTAWITPSYLLNTKPIELELLYNIKERGFDITAVIQRVEALYVAIRDFEEKREQMNRFKQILSLELSRMHPEREHGMRIEV